MDTASAGLEVLVLGGVRVRRDGVDLRLGGRRQRVVVAVLVIAGGEAVAADALGECVWGSDPPDDAVPMRVHDGARARDSRTVALARHGVVEPAADDTSDVVGLRAAIAAALAMLPPAQPRAVTLRHVLGCTTTETARLLRVPPSTARSHCSRGPTRLRVAMTALAA